MKILKRPRHRARRVVLALCLVVAICALAQIAVAQAAVTAAPSNTLDVTGIVQAVLETAALVIAGLIARFVPRLIDILQQRTGIMLTAQQRQTVLHGVQTAAGIIETQIDQGLIQVSHVRIDNPAVLAQARHVIEAVPMAAAAMGVTEAGVAGMIVGAVDTGSRVTPAPTPAVLAPAPAVLGIAPQPAAPAAASAPTRAAPPAVPALAATPAPTPAPGQFAGAGAATT